MFFNYLKIAFRSSLRNGTTSLVNFLGLTVGIVSSLLIFIYVSHELSYDRFHDKTDRIFKVLSIDEALGVNNNIVGITMPALAPGMEKEIPGVENIVRINGSGKTLVEFNDNSLYTEKLFFSEPSFFEIFDFELVEGDPKTCLEKPTAAILTESMARKVFGDEDPMGKIFSAAGNDDLEVTGILKDPDKPSHIEYDIIVSMNPTPNDSNYIGYLNSWQSISQTQYVLLEDPGRKDEIIVEMDSLLRRYDAPVFWHATLKPLKEVHLYSSDVLFDNFNREKGDIKYVRSLSLIAIIILMIASFNYMNLSTARSAKRAKEVGIRKTAGASRRKLIFQYLSEAITQVFISLVVSLAIIEFINNYYNIIDTSVFVHLSNDPVIIIYLLALVVFLGILSGIYPAMILSAYKPQVVLKGKFESGKKGLWLRRFLVTIQFIATFVMIVGILVVHSQLRYTFNKDKGFDTSQIVNIELNSREIRENFEALRTELEKIPGVKKVATSGSMPGLGFGRTGVQPEGSSEEENWIVSIMSMDENYVPLMNMKLVEGENFRKNMSIEPLPIIIN
ncbi:MAG: cell division protein FtsX [Marinilabiliales bacterium]|nr:MAG: cell division protein FtsX [Marinilabiliales bacterium]